MTTKDALHRLVDELPDRELKAAQRFLEYLRNLGDPVLRTLEEAPYDDEPETDAERHAVAEARADFQADRLLTHADIIRRRSHPSRSS